MRAEEFSSLAYNDQLHLINRSGKLKQSSIVNDHQVTLYSLKGFYVELTRNIHELRFEHIVVMRPADLPDSYQKFR